MGLSVKFNDQELGKYLNVLSGFSPFNGVDRETELLDGAESCKKGKITGIQLISPEQWKCRLNSLGTSQRAIMQSRRF